MVFKGTSNFQPSFVQNHGKTSPGEEIQAHLEFKAGLGGCEIPARSSRDRVWAASSGDSDSSPGFAEPWVSPCFGTGTGASNPQGTKLQAQLWQLCTMPAWEGTAGTRGGDRVDSSQISSANLRATPSLWQQEKCKSHPRQGWIRTQHGRITLEIIFVLL